MIFVFSSISSKSGQSLLYLKKEREVVLYYPYTVEQVQCQALHLKSQKKTYKEYKQAEGMVWKEGHRSLG